MSRLQEKYYSEVTKKLSKSFGIKNMLALPKIEKVVVNMGIGEATKNKELLEEARTDMAKFTGQLPSIRLARVSVASFGLRKGSPVGLKVTLRGKRMYEFLDKLFSIVLPRLRDFRGLNRDSFDKYGNYTLGLTEHTLFPEVQLGKIGSRGLEITIVTNTENKKQAEDLLENMGMPFKKNDQESK
ncbi:50S ribosomal protein L5 [Candidatus Woesebacteria bacterium]|nr:50S ribosomal protein L5 [Candidatus Woesebacteria bacterium]